MSFNKSILLAGAKSASPPNASAGSVSTGKLTTTLKLLADMNADFTSSMGKLYQGGASTINSIFGGIGKLSG